MNIFFNTTLLKQSQGFEKKFEDFASEYSHIFIQSMELKTSEHPLEFMDVYNEYLNRLEGYIEDFIASEGYTAKGTGKKLRYSFQILFLSSSLLSILLAAALLLITITSKPPFSRCHINCITFSSHDSPPSLLS